MELNLRDSVECDFVGEQKSFPRIGEDYQVEIPVIVGRSDYLNHDATPKAVKSHALDYFLGVSVPVTSSIIQDDKKLEHEELVPGSASDSWNDADKASFILGLYIFSRNFAWLKQFLESKKMEDILSFYYGEFYRSHAYRQWSKSRKTRKRGVVGQKIFTGPRMKKHLSRIFPSLSKERKNAALQVLKTFGEGEIPFEEFIFSIKEIIGITTMTLEPSTSNQVNQTGKTFSSLTPNEIMKYLNGGCRLSKSRSHDLFSEAVWPRLLARGWNTEGPKGQVSSSTGLNNNLVFLVPGVTKFSRPTLKKGIDYFDSVSDVLNKIASDPSLLELDNGEEDSEAKSATEGMKFTVVDTCSGDWKPYKVRELIGLTFDIYRNEDIEEADAVNSDTPLLVIDDSQGSSSKDRDIDDDPVKVVRPRSDSGSALANENGNNEKLRKGKSKSGMEEDNSHNVLPVNKRRRLTARNNAEPRMPEVAVTCGQEITKRIVVMALPAASANLRPEKRNRYSKVHDESLRCSSSTTRNAECDDIPDFQQADRIRNNFDLNLLPPESENESNGGEHNDEMAKSQLNHVSPQRRGTRNRPPTARALEAVAYGFLSTNTRHKGRAGNGRTTSTSSSRSQRARGETEEIADDQINPVEPIIHPASQSNPSS